MVLNCTRNHLNIFSHRASTLRIISSNSFTLFTIFIEMSYSSDDAGHLNVKKSTDLSTSPDDLKGEWLHLRYKYIPLLPRWFDLAPRRLLTYGTLREGPYSKQGAYFFFEIQQYARNKAWSKKKNQVDWKMDFLFLIIPGQIDQPSNRCKIWRPVHLPKGTVHSREHNRKTERNTTVFAMRTLEENEPRLIKM